MQRLALAGVDYLLVQSEAKQRIFGTQVLASLRAEQTQQISQDCFGPHIVVVTLAHALYTFFIHFRILHVLSPPSHHLFTGPGRKAR